MLVFSLSGREWEMLAALAGAGGIWLGSNGVRARTGYLRVRRRLQLAARTDAVEKASTRVPFRSLLSDWRNTHHAAALHLRLEEYWGLVALSGVVGGAAGFVLRGPAGGLLLAIGGVVGVRYYFRWRRQRWLQQAESQLPEFLAGLATSLRAGSSLPQALTLVGRETDDPLGTEIRRMGRREALGDTLDMALEDLARRVPSRELELAIIAIQTQREVGGTLAPLLDSVVETVAERQRLKAEVRTLTAAGRASGAILTLLPIGLGLVIWFINPAYVKPVFTTGIGHLMLGYGVLSLGIGTVVIRRMVRGPEL